MTDPIRPVRSPAEERPQSRWRLRLFEIIFESDTPAGRWFDILLLWSISLAALAVVLESVASIRAVAGDWLWLAEWCFTVLFTIEYVARLIAVRRPLRYARSFFGVIDLVSVLPMYIELLLPGTHFIVVVRVLRLLRVFRIFKLGRYLGEAHVLLSAMRASRPKITVFLTFVGASVIIVGALMHLVEGPENGFDDIPTSIYWAIVTLCTVGYGDIVPHTPLGKGIASLLMIMGYGVIAVPTGIVGAELARLPRSVSGQSCPSCALSAHEADAVFCRRCGVRL